MSYGAEIHGIDAAGEVRSEKSDPVSGSWEEPPTEVISIPTELGVEAAKRNGFVQTPSEHEYSFTGAEHPGWAETDKAMQIAAGGDVVEANFVDLDPLAIERMAEVMAEGSAKYGPPTEVWNRIAVVAHINHALGHLFKYLAGDTTEDHLGHAACRTMGALGKALRDQKQYETAMDEHTEPHITLNASDPRERDE
jgi:hypothetical protein